MICKKCGAYNPDHATFCKVCAANLKEQPDVDEEKVVDAEEVAEEELRPKRGHVKAPDFAAARRAGTFTVAQKEEEEMPKGKETTALKSLSQARSWEARSLFTFSWGSSPCAGLSNGVGWGPLHPTPSMMALPMPCSSPTLTCDVKPGAAPTSGLGESVLGRPPPWPGSRPPAPRGSRR